MSDGPIEQVAGLGLSGLHRGPKGLDEGGNMPREFLVILDRLDGRIDGSALGVTKDKYKRRSEHGHGVLEAGDRIDVREIARYAAYEEVSAARIESILRSDARVCAPQDSGEGILSERQRGTLGDEIVALHSSFNVAIVSFQETFERGVRRQSVLRFGRRTDFRRPGSSQESETDRRRSGDSQETAAAKFRGVAGRVTFTF